MKWDSMAYSLPFPHSPSFPVFPLYMEEMRDEMEIKDTEIVLSPPPSTPRTGPSALSLLGWLVGDLLILAPTCSEFRVPLGSMHKREGRESS